MINCHDTVASTERSFSKFKLIKQVSYDRQQTILISHVVNWSFMLSIEANISHVVNRSFSVGSWCLILCLEKISLHRQCRSFMCAISRFSDVIKAFAWQKTHSKPFWYYYIVTMLMKFFVVIVMQYFHVCYWATVQWFLLFFCMTTVHQLSSLHFGGGRVGLLWNASYLGYL